MTRDVIRAVFVLCAAAIAQQHRNIWRRQRNGI
jgi:hypothetical protein